MLVLFSASPLAERLRDTAYPLLTATLTIGLLSMATIQILKDTLPIRRMFQRRWLRQWLYEHSRRLKEVNSSKPEFDISKAEAQLIGLATDGDSSALYSLPIEQLCGQLNAAAQAVLEQPELNEDLLLHLASNAGRDDIQFVLNCSRFYRNQTGVRLEGEARAHFSTCVDARNRVAYQVQRAIDSLQLSVSNYWKLFFQVCSIVLSGTFALVGLSLFGEPGGPWRQVGITFAIAILGGFVAPVAHDVIAGLQSLRK